MERNTTTPAARPPARPVIGLGGASARPGEREGPRGRGSAQAGRGEPAGRSRRGAGARVPGIAERAWGGRESHQRGREPGGLSAEPGELRASHCSARSRNRRSARPRSLPGGSGAAAGCSLTCRPFPCRAAQKDRGSRPRDALQPVAASRTPRGAPDSMATGLGEPVYGLSEEEVSSCSERCAEGTGPTPL